jgi:hypothetical protein
MNLSAASRWTCHSFCIVTVRWNARLFQIRRSLMRRTQERAAGAGASFRSLPPLAFAGPATRGTLSAGKRIRISRAATVMVGAWVHVFMKAFHAVEPLFHGRALVVGEHPAPW